MISLILFISLILLLFYYYYYYYYYDLPTRADWSIVPEIRNLQLKSEALLRFHVKCLSISTIPAIIKCLTIIKSNILNCWVKYKIPPDTSPPLAESPSWRSPQFWLNPPPPPPLYKATHESFEFSLQPP